MGDQPNGGPAPVDTSPESVARLVFALRSPHQIATEEQSAAMIEALAARVAELEAKRDNHWETLRSIREVAENTGDLARIIQWVNDAGSGYTETAEATLAAEMDRRVAAEARVAALTEALVEIEGSPAPDRYCPHYEHCVDVARAALKGATHD